jgi:hypothetical protein
MDTRSSNSSVGSSARLSKCAHTLVNQGYFSIDLDTNCDDPSLTVRNLAPLTLSNQEFERLVSRAARQHDLSLSEAEDPLTLMVLP